MTLELGGKSPVIIDPTYDLKLAAKRVLWGKINNCGQICVAPDFVLIPREKQDEFIDALKEHYQAFYPEGALNSKSIGRIVSSAHFKRLEDILARTKGEVVMGGKTTGEEGLRFEPTVVKDVKGDDSLMEGCVPRVLRGPHVHLRLCIVTGKYSGLFCLLSLWTISTRPLTM